MQCSKCLTDRLSEEFSWKSKALGKRSTICKFCQRLYGRKHYQDNSETYKAKSKGQQKKTISRNKEFIIEYLRLNPCVDCGEKDIEVLQFDHIDMVRGKGKRIGNFLQASLLGLKREIEKCEIRCANCHVRRTRRQMNWERI